MPRTPHDVLGHSVAGRCTQVQQRTGQPRERQGERGGRVVALPEVDHPQSVETAAHGEDGGQVRDGLCGMLVAGHRVDHGHPVLVRQDTQLGRVVRGPGHERVQHPREHRPGVRHGLPGVLLEIVRTVGDDVGAEAVGRDGERGTGPGGRPAEVDAHMGARERASRPTARGVLGRAVHQRRQRGRIEVVQGEQMPAAHNGHRQVPAVLNLHASVSRGS